MRAKRSALQSVTAIGHQPEGPKRPESLANCPALKANAQASTGLLIAAGIARLAESAAPLQRVRPKMSMARRMKKASITSRMVILVLARRTASSSLIWSRALSTAARISSV